MLRLYKMPRLPTDYSRTIIYKIVKNDDFENANVYVGSTTEFVKRKCGHQNNCNNENSKKHNYKVYKSIRSNGGWNEWSMIEIEKFPCNNKREALSRERYWYEFYNAKLNSMTMIIRPEQAKEQRKQYNLDNADKIKQYNLDNADKHKQYNKQYYIDNADKIKQKDKQYRIDNSDKIKQKITCECGGKYTLRSKSIHRKSQKHINFISSQQEVAVP